MSTHGCNDDNDSTQTHQDLRSRKAIRHAKRAAKVLASHLLAMENELDRLETEQNAVLPVLSLADQVEYEDYLDSDGRIAALVPMANAKAAAAAAAAQNADAELYDMEECHGTTLTLAYCIRSTIAISE